MPDCPSCGSSQVVPVVRASRSRARARRRGNATSSTLATTARPGDWACGDCGHRWAEDESPNGGAAALQEPPGAEPTEFGSEPEPRGEASAFPEAAAATLRRRREERGLALADVARSTGIWERYLRALEEDEPPESFPGHAYARFFLREYAQQLELEPEPLVRAYEERHVDEEAIEAEAPRPVPDPRRRVKMTGRILVALSALVLVALVVVPQLTGEGSAPSTSPSPAAPSVSAAVAPIEPTSSPTPEAVRSIRAVLETSERSWVAAFADGRRVVWRTLEAGEHLSVRADRLLQLRLGNAGGVVLRVDGELVPTGASGDIVDLAFRLRDGVLTTLR